MGPEAPGKGKDNRQHGKHVADVAEADITEEFLFGDSPSEGNTADWS